MQTATDLPRIPLAALHLSPLNARKTRGQDVDSLASSIAAHGLLQNLTVTVNEKPGEFEVVAGGRRLAAMQQLLREGRLPERLQRDGVPCLVIEDADVAHEASTAENTLREAMHPADQFEAFKRMVDNGKAVSDIAAHFGAPETLVRQRLKLANLNPKFLAMYREGGIALDQLQALALTDDHEEQRKAWYGVKNDWERSARQLRDRITKKELGPDNPLVKFVGVEAYEAAGGKVRRDLFSAAVYFSDRALLDKLSLDKLEAMAQTYRDAGWSWVDVHLSLDYAGLAEYPQIGSEPKHQPPTDADKVRMSEIDERVSALEKEQEAIEAADSSDDRYDLIDDELYELKEEHAVLKRGRQIWPDAAVAKSGVVIYIDHSHGLRIVCGRLRPGQKVSTAGEVTGKAKPKEEDKPKKATLSADMVQRLEMHRAAATREHIAARPADALQLLITSMVMQMLTNSSDGGLFELRAGNIHRQAEGLIQSKFPDLGKAPARKALDVRIAQWKQAGLPTKGSDVLPWVAKQPQAKQLELLALLLAMTLNTNPGHVGAAIAEQLDVDMRTWWTASPDTYFSIVPKALLVEAVADIGGKAAGEKLATLKKDGAIAEAAKTLNGTTWLPKPLRGAAYKAGKTKSVAPAKAPAKAAKKAKPTAKGASAMAFGAGSAVPNKPAKTAKKKAAS